ncbi:MAG: acyltransferase [Ruminococcaceae bacterium]|nr:acyltransferase [Oscillospiraceae bacterium]
MQTQHFSLPHKIEFLQVLRFLAALSVSLFHFSVFYHYITPRTIYTVSFFVQLFFFISSFLTMHTTNTKEKGKHFFIRRLIRLIPLYWLLTIFTFFASCIIPEIIGYKPTIIELFKSLFFIPYERASLKSDIILRSLVGLGHTIQMEIAFSLLFMIVMKISHKNRGVLAIIFCAFLSLLGKIFTFNNPILKFYITNNHITWISFCAGILCYYLIIYISSKKLSIKKWYSTILSFLLLALSCILVHIFRKQITTLNITAYCWCIIFILTMFFTIICSCFKLFSPKLLVSIGNASFSYYLLHYYIISVGERIFGINDFSPRNIIIIISMIVLSWVISYISWYIIEKKFGNILSSIFLKN